ncbi:MAG: SDR family oxidoreductase [Ferruginibacter sp.]
MESLKDKYILLAGATGGIGRELARLLTGSGARLFITGRKEELLREVATECRLSEDCLLAADLTDINGVKALKQAYEKVYPTVDILINLSGIGIIQSTENLEEADFMRTLQVNLYAPYMLTRAFLPVMKEAKKGLIIHVPGVLGKVPMAGAAAYSASKYGLVGMMQSIREEVKRTEIRITNLFLGGVDSPFWDKIDLRVQREKMIRADEAARSIWFLCQQPSSGVISEMVLQPFNHQAI